jgi:toxin ParE1/3/4
MVKIIWTQRALTDLKSIAEYISKDSVRYASLTLDKIREIIFGNYRIIYKINNTLTVNILTVHHSAKKLRQTSLKGQQ